MEQVVTLVIVDPCVTVKHVVSGVVPSSQEAACHSALILNGS